ncbi:MAG: outer-membrane lipoprotein carrier protein LolA [Pseudomonadota bacterium]
MTRTLTRSLHLFMMAGLAAGLFGVSGAAAGSNPSLQAPQTEPVILAQARPTPPGTIAPAPAPVRPNAPAGKPGETTAFDNNQRALVDRISQYLSGMRQVVGKFVQVGPDGRKTTGDLFLQKPGKLRFEYDDPSPVQLIADGTSLVVRDRRLATQDLYPLGQTPLRFLLADKVDLLRDTNVVNVYSDDIFSTVVIEEKQTLGGKHKLMLMFDAKDLTLKQWTVTDPQGFDTTVAIYNLDMTKKPDPALFKINYERMIE